MIYLAQQHNDKHINTRQATKGAGEEGANNMKRINVQTPDGTVEMVGTCLSSELQWSKNVEQREHIKNGTYSTKQVPTDYFAEVWEIEGDKVNLAKFETEKTIKYMIQE